MRGEEVTEKNSVCPSAPAETSDIKLNFKKILTPSNSSIEEMPSNAKPREAWPSAPSDSSMDEMCSNPKPDEVYAPSNSPMVAKPSQVCRRSKGCWLLVSFTVITLILLAVFISMKVTKPVKSPFQLNPKSTALVIRDVPPTAAVSDGEVEAQASTGGTWAYFYEHANYEGQAGYVNQGDLWSLGSWNDYISSLRVPSNGWVVMYEHSDFGGAFQVSTTDRSFVGYDWNDKASSLKVRISASGAVPVSLTTCNGAGGTCGCGYSNGNTPITLNRFYGDNSDEKVWGCGGGFGLDGATWNRQWGGSLDSTGPQGSISDTVGLSFSSSASFYGWEGCCYICGLNLQMAGVLSEGWHCAKDSIFGGWGATGIWLKGKNK
eukprot:gb/GEZN01006972.1/.p1 GENE.gb/GEZN01006972.1/~~gb/GEZN01006972.1/.p1  ORF type:complete len:376 (-),score=21.07 gb/GEZN01006972.1/:265-1392(-)